MAGSRIPTTIPKFNTYINSTDDFLQEVIDIGPPQVTNASRLGLTMQNAADWHTKRLNWRDNLFAKWSNPITKTSSINKQVAAFMKTFSAFGSPLIEKKISVSDNATQDDADLFNFKLTRKAPTRPTTRITELCFASITPLGGGRMQAKFRTSHDTKRASRPEAANVIEVAFKASEPPPQNPNDGTTRDTIPKASDVFDLGAENAGKKVYAYFRWKNTKYPDLAGQWSERYGFNVA